MITFWLKKLLSFVDVSVRFYEGDMVHVKIFLGEKCVLDRVIDVLPKV